MNYLVCNSSPSLPSGTWSWTDTGDYTDLATEFADQLARDHLAITTGPIDPAWAVRLLEEIESNSYHAVLGPPSPFPHATGERLLQVYLFRNGNASMLPIT